MGPRTDINIAPIFAAPAAWHSRLRRRAPAQLMFGKSSRDVFRRFYMSLRTFSTINLASVQSGTDAFDCKTLSSPVVEHSPFNPRDLPTSFAHPKVSEELIGHFERIEPRKVW
jgi:hypothetical protein